MKPIHFKLQPRAPVGTAFCGDTLIGHLIWQYAYEYGQSKMEEFFEQVKFNPPACTDLFPEGKLPIPSYPLNFEALESNHRKMLKKVGAGDQGIELDDVHLESNHRKMLKKVRFIDARELKRLQDGLKEKLLCEAIQAEAPTESGNFFEEATTLHASINRLTGTTTEAAASLFARPVTFYKSSKPLHGYLAPGALGDEKVAKELLERVGEFGYGADASSGLGVFDVTFDEEQLHMPEMANSWMALSRHLCDTGCNPQKAYYGLETHYGRLGGAFAGSGNVFKHPIMLCKTGALWEGWEDRVRGSMLENVVTRSDVNIRHLGYTIPLAFHMTEDFR